MYREYDHMTIVLICSRNFDTQHVGNREKFYSMNNKIRGYCIIFNVEDVGGRIRNGTNIDAKRMENCFKHLGFHVVVRQNPSRAIINSTMKGCKLIYNNYYDMPMTQCKLTYNSVYKTISIPIIQYLGVIYQY